MDRFFDEAARILASPTSRRRALRLLGGALIGSIFGLASIKQAGAQAPTCKPPCKKNETCCGKVKPTCCAKCAGQRCVVSHPADRISDTLLDLKPTVFVAQHSNER